MPQLELHKYAKQMLKRRDTEPSMWYYFLYNWRRQLLILIGCIITPIALWALGWTTWAIAVACFFASSKIRDLRWGYALSKAWPMTTELFDWDKIERLTSESGEPNSSETSSNT